MTHRNTCSGKLPVLLLTLAALAAFQPGFAEDQDIEQLRNAAEQGDAGARFKLGLKYYLGEGVQRRLLGEGVPKNYRKAFEWGRKAAEHPRDDE